MKLKQRKPQMIQTERWGSVIILAIILSMTARVAQAEKLPKEVTTLLQKCKQTTVTQEAVERLHQLVNRNSKDIREAFVHEVRRIGGAGGTPIDADRFLSSVFSKMDKYQFDLATDIAMQVAAKYPHGVEAVIRTGSSGSRHMELNNKGSSAGRYKMLMSDDDISFLGSKGDEAAEMFNELCKERGLGTARVTGFGMDTSGDLTSYDILVKQIKNKEAFVGSAGFGGIRKEMLEKGGAVVAIRQGNQLVATAETVADFVKRNPGGTLADVMDVARIRADLDQFGPLTMYASCLRQMEHADPREKVKYLLRTYAAMDASGTFADAAVHSSQKTTGYFQAIGKELSTIYDDTTGVAARKFLTPGKLRNLETDAYEAVLLTTCSRMRKLVTKAEAEAGQGAVNLMRHPELRRMIHEMAAGIELIRESGHKSVATQLFTRLQSSTSDVPGNLFYKILYTAVTDANTLHDATGAVTEATRIWTSARNSDCMIKTLKELGPEAESSMKRLAEVGSVRMPRNKGGEAAIQMGKILEHPHGNKFLWKMVSNKTAQKFMIEAAVNAPFAIYAMYDAWSKGEMKDLHDAAFVLIDFVPMGMSVKKAGLEGINLSTTAAFVKESLYFTPAWPIALGTDVIIMSWTIADAVQLQAESEGLVDVLVYNGVFDHTGNNFHLESLSLPGGKTVPRNEIWRWLTETKSVQVKHTLDNKSYFINNLSKKMFNVFNNQYVANDPALQQMRLAMQEQLDAVNFEEAAKYFTKYGQFGGLYGYTMWMAGINTVCDEGNSDNWCRLYKYMGQKIDTRKDDILKKEMPVRLIYLAEEKAAVLHAEEDLSSELRALQGKLERLRGTALEVNLADEVTRRADDLANASDSVVFGRIDTREQKTMTRGDYWQKAYDAYSRILKIIAGIPESIETRTGISSDRIKVLRFKWSGAYEEDLRLAEQSKSGFALDLRKIRVDITSIKGSIPDTDDSVDLQAMDILGDVLFRWRAVLDSGGHAAPGNKSYFQKDYGRALKKVRKLYDKNNDFSDLLAAGARVVLSQPNVPLDGSIEAALRFKDSTLQNDFEAGKLTLVWKTKPHGTVTRLDTPAHVRLNVLRPEPVLLSVKVTRSGVFSASGACEIIVPVTVPEDFLTLTIDPTKPMAQKPIKCVASVPDKYIGVDSAFHYEWKGENCDITLCDCPVTKATAPKSGKAAVEVTLLADRPDGSLEPLAHRAVNVTITEIGELEVQIQGQKRYEDGEPIVLDAQLSGLEAGGRNRLDFNWEIAGLNVGKSDRCFLGTLPKGKYEIGLGVTLRTEDSPPQKAGARHEFEVVKAEDPEVAVTVTGPVKVDKGDAAVLHAAISASNASGKRLAEQSWIEWTVDDQVYETGPDLNLDTSRKGEYEITARIVAESNGKKRTVTEKIHRIVVGDVKPADPQEDVIPSESTGGSGGLTWSPGRPNTHGETVLRVKFSHQVTKPAIHWFIGISENELPTVINDTTELVHRFEKPGNYTIVVILRDWDQPMTLLGDDYLERLESKLTVTDDYFTVKSPTSVQVGDRIPVSIELPPLLAARCKTFTWRILRDEGKNNEVVSVSLPERTATNSAIMQGATDQLSQPVFIGVTAVESDGHTQVAVGRSSLLQISMPNVTMDCSWKKEKTSDGFAMIRTDAERKWPSDDKRGLLAPKARVTASLTVRFLQAVEISDGSDFSGDRSFNPGNYTGKMESWVKHESNHIHSRGYVYAKAACRYARIIAEGSVDADYSSEPDECPMWAKAELQRAYNELLTAIDSIDVSTMEEAAEDAGELSVSLFSDPPAISVGGAASVTAAVKGGKPEYTFKWTGFDEQVGPDHVTVIGSREGKRHVTLTVQDSAGGSAQAELTLNVQRPEARVVRTVPEKGPVAFGQTAGFRANIVSGDTLAPGKYLYRWQPNTEVEFDPMESDSALTTARFTQPGKVKIWVEILKQENGSWVTVDESDQMEIEVKPPGFTLEIAPFDPLVGEEATVTLKTDPAVPLKDLDVRWIPENTALKIGPGDNALQCTVIPKNTAPAKITALVIASADRSDLGQVSTKVVARSFDVTVSKPERLGSPPKVWKKGIGLVEDERAIGVFQEVFVSASVSPDSTRLPLRYRWTSSPGGCNILSPSSQETRVSASETGTYTLEIVVSNRDGVELGRGSVSMAVTVDDNANRGKDKQDESAKPKPTQKPTQPPPSAHKKRSAEGTWKGKAIVSCPNDTRNCQLEFTVKKNNAITGILTFPNPGGPNIQVKLTGTYNPGKRAFTLKGTSRFKDPADGTIVTINGPLNGRQTATDRAEGDGGKFVISISMATFTDKRDWVVSWTAER